MARIPTRLTPALAEEWRQSGHWPATPLGCVLRASAERRPAAVAVADDHARLTYAALDALVDRLAAGLAERGLGPGDVVSCILPNRAEVVALFYAAARLGAVLNPIVPIYGRREIGFILRQAETALVVVPERARGSDLRALVADLAPELPALRHTVVLGDSVPAELLGTPRPLAVPSPDDVAVILYTSGTTADPKGVLHSHATLLAECQATVRYHGFGDDEVFVMPSPVSHISGLLYGVLLPIVLGARSVLMGAWDPAAFCALVAREGGTFSAGATPFLQGVLELPDLERYDLGSLRLFPCGGADVPPDVIRQAMRRLHVRSGRGYGSTEFPSITSAAGPDVPDPKRAETDGRPVEPNRIELRDADGAPVPPGTPGEIWARGPELCLGYRDATLDADAFDARGYFRTGDLGVVDDDGYLTITGRVKDIVIRRGEKFSAKEIEDLLFEHPQVRQVAVIPVSDPAVGERVCAVVVPRDPATPPTLDALVRFLDARGLSRRKFPERLEIAIALPVTASGKIQKHVLRARFDRKDPA
jgi:cyclohexanecarboxylate-CoA ligase